MGLSSEYFRDPDLLFLFKKTTCLFKDKFLMILEIKGNNNIAL